MTQRKRHPWMKVWTADWHSSRRIQRMTLEQRGAYWELLLYAWDEGSIPDDTEALARLLGVTPQRFRSKIWPAIEGAWESNGRGGLINRRQEKERREAQARSRAGQKAAEAKWAREALVG